MSGQRYYSPELGRWTSRDPIAEEGGLNVYGFVASSPIDAHDYLGLEPCQVIIWVGHSTVGNSILKNISAGDYKDDKCIKHAVFGCYSTTKIINANVLPKDRFVSRHPRIDFWVHGGFYSKVDGLPHLRRYDVDADGKYARSPYHAPGKSWEAFNYDLFRAILGAAFAEGRRMANDACLMHCECGCEKVDIVLKPVENYNSGLRWHKRLRALAEWVREAGISYEATSKACPIHEDE